MFLGFKILLVIVGCKDRNAGFHRYDDDSELGRGGHGMKAECKTSWMCWTMLIGMCGYGRY